MKIIINADDCGISAHVNSEIEKYINQGIISSTTVMANMDDFDGAVQLFTKYKSQISFGIHFNLTEGMPILYSQPLLDAGYYREVDNKICFNERDFDYTTLTPLLKEDIYKELEAQLKKIKDSGISVSHFDSHRHTHIHKETIPIFCRLAKKYGITKMRKRQFESSLVEIIKECVWKAILKHNNPKLISTDLFFSTEYFLNNISRFGNKTIVELMCHPGHKGDNYDRENSMMEKLIPEYIEQEKFELITWNDL